MDKDDLVLLFEEWFYRLKSMKNKATVFLYIAIAIMVAYYVLTNLFK